jgi:hypothetical protein
VTVAAERHVSDDERDENRRVAESIIAVTALLVFGALCWNCADGRGVNGRRGMAEVQALCRGTLRAIVLQAVHPRAARR